MKTYGLIFTNEDPRSAPSASLAPTLVTFFQLGGSTLAAPGITKPIPTVGLYTFEYNPGLTLPVYFLADGGALVTDNTLRYLSGMIDPIQQVDQQAQTLTAIGLTTLVNAQSAAALGSLNLSQGSSIVSYLPTLAALGTTNVAIGTTNIALGSTNIAFGSTNFALNTSIYASEVSLTANGVSVYAAALTLLAQTQTISVNISLSAVTLDLINLKLGTTLSVVGDNTVDPGDVFGYLKRLQEFNEGNQTFNKNTGVWDISSRGNTLLAEKTLTNTSAQVTKS